MNQLYLINAIDAVLSFEDITEESFQDAIAVQMSRNISPDDIGIFSLE